MRTSRCSKHGPAKEQRWISESVSKILLVISFSQLTEKDLFCNFKFEPHLNWIFICLGSCYLFSGGIKQTKTSAGIYVLRLVAEVYNGCNNIKCFNRIYMDAYAVRL